MLSFFQKKEFLIDILEDFVDIHNHILPGIDDGARNVQESLDMLYAFQEIGFRKFICSPHVFKDCYPNTPETVRKSHLQLVEALSGLTDLKVSLDFSAEHMVDEHLEEILESGQYLPLSDSYLLVEMPFIQASLNMPNIVKICKEKGIFPILAHPERYRYLHHSRGAFARYRDMGMFFQINLLSLTGYYGKSIQAKALELLENGMVSFLGTDVHKAEEIVRLKNCQIPGKVKLPLEKAYHMNLESFHL